MYPRIVFFALLLCALPAQARVGETVDMLERRLLANASAARMPAHDLEIKRERGNTPPIQNEFTEELGNIPRPDGGTVLSPLKIQSLMPPGLSTDVVFYLKSDTGRPTGINVTSLRNWTPNDRPNRQMEKSNPVLNDSMTNLRMKFTGWELMVLYANKVSVMEVYRRINSYITPAEIEGLLALNTGGSSWKKVPKETRVDSLFPYEYETEDGKLRARTVSTGSNVTTLIVFNAEMADGLRQAQVALKKQHQAERDVQKSLAQF